MKRKFLATVATAALLAGGVALAAPASAVGSYATCSSGKVSVSATGKGKIAITVPGKATQYFYNYSGYNKTYKVVGTQATGNWSATADQGLLTASAYCA